MVNATNPTALDWTDGGSPCATTGGAHSTGDGWSSKGIWTDVKVREGNIGTLFGSFGISLPQIAAQARVKVEPIIGVGSNGLPFIAETGDQIECVWAQFVRARDGSTTGFTVTPSNPILLTETVEPHLDRERDQRPVHERGRRRRDPLLGRQQERKRTVRLRQRPEEAAPP